ncbi:hypothetical protein M231_02490 [Tremella mesenterica]|uniref:SAC3/GANP/THP3 conserved domain-containing protein n=1 Tax=Tremella mesenterica TaxID=5217 RepID=A0A4Q1BQK5_TREME|nr:hypothetical protein M231_02490 [Tremella mesenterica]
MANLTALESGNPDSDDESRKASRLAARAARFSQKLPGNRYKELEEMRAKQRKAFEQSGQIKTGKIELEDAVDMRGTCETMCSEYEREFREYTREVHPFEAGPSKRIDPQKAVAAYSRSDAGAGHGDSAILPSDLRTPQTLVKTLDYLFSKVMLIQPPLTGATSSYSRARKALGYSAGFIRDRTRAIRKEFAMQSSWGHEEAINSYERIARWHILCLRELQEETGTNTDMHIDSAELGRCFTSLRQQYNDRREETGLEMPCPNEPEFRAYMLIFDLAHKSVSIPIAELPQVILDHPLVKIAWNIRNTAQRNFDSQKEGSKLNAELGSNLITQYVRLLKDKRVPFLLACLVEIRLREMRRSALRSLNRTYPRLRTEPIRVNEAGEVVERKMVLISTLEQLLGCEEQESEDSAWDDVERGDGKPSTEVVEIVQRFGLEVYNGPQGPIGALINSGAPFNDNKDAPYTKRWKLITAKNPSASYVDIVNGLAGVQVEGGRSYHSLPTIVVPPTRTQPPVVTHFNFGPITTPKKSPPKSTFNFLSTASTALALPPSITTPSQAPSFPLLPSATSAKLPPTIAPSNKAPQFNFKFTPATPLPPPSASPAPLFTQPGLFSNLSQSAGTTITSLRSPPKSLLATSQPPAAPPVKSDPIPTHTQIISTRVVSRKSGLSPTERQRRLDTAPTLSSDLISEVIDRLLDNSRPMFRKILKQELAAREYSTAKNLRKEKIEDWSRDIFSMIHEEIVYDICKQAILVEIGKRAMLRRTLRHWKRWARRKRLLREDAERQRQEAFDRLSIMGVGPSGSMIGWSDGLATPLTENGELPGERKDEFEIDMALHQSLISIFTAEDIAFKSQLMEVSTRAVFCVGIDEQVEKTKDQFYTPSTFFHSIARYVAPLLNPSKTPTTMTAFTIQQQLPDRPLSQWRTILSSAKQSGSPPPDEAERWLAGKLLPRLSNEFEYEGIIFDAVKVDRYDPPSGEYTGLVVFEVPLRTNDEGQIDGNVGDAQDRMTGLVYLANRGQGAYIPSLLLVTWETESLDEVCDRLDIREDVRSFQNVQILSLESAENVDISFQQCLTRLFPSVTIREKIELSHAEAVNAMLPSWERFLQAVQVLLSTRPMDVGLILNSFGLGVNALMELSKILTSMTKVSLEITKLPSFRADGEDVLSAVENIADYVSQEVFNGLDEINLLVPPLRHAAQRGQALPVPELLHAIALVVFAELNDDTSPLIMIPTTKMPNKRVVLSSLANRYASYMDEVISHIAQFPATLLTSSTSSSSRPTDESLRSSSSQHLPSPSRYPSPSFETHSLTSSPTYPNIPRKTAPSSPPQSFPLSSSSPMIGQMGMGTKRPRESSSPLKQKRRESKALKKAKLLRAMAEVSRTLGEMEIAL